MPSKPRIGKIVYRQIDATHMRPDELAVEVEAVWLDYCKRNHCSVSVPDVGSEVWEGNILVTRRRVEHAKQEGEKS